MAKTEKVRLQKFLADSGIASRRAAEEMIAKGLVSVNGRLVSKPGTKVDPERDSVKLRGKLVRGRPAILYILVNKPMGYVSAAGDSEEAPAVTSLVPRRYGRLFPVGRLDLNSEGLLVLTNDGEMAQRISHPSNGVVKTYEVKVRGRTDVDTLRRIMRGVISEGERLVPLGVRVMRKLEGGAWLEFKLVEGKNREIRRICDAVALRISRLRRVSIGRLRLGLMEPGEWRLATYAEMMSALKKSTRKR